MGEWPMATLEELATTDGFAIGPFGSRMKTEHYVDHGCRVVRGQNITSAGRIEGDFVRISEEFAKSLGNARLAPGDITLPHRGAIGRAALVTADDMVMSTSLMRVRLDRKVADPRFVLAYLTSRPGENEILQFASTVGTPGIGQPLASLRKVQVPFPPLDEQRRIAGVLGALDDLIETNRQQIGVLRETSQALFAAAAVDGEKKAFDDTAQLVREGVSRDALTEGTPYLGLEHFGTDGAGIIGVGDAGILDSNKSKFDSGDVLYGKLRPYFRKYDRPGFSGVCSTEIWVLRGVQPYGAATVAALVAQPEFTEFAMQGSSGTRMPRADWTHVARSPVLVPSADRLGGLERQLDSFWRASVGLQNEIADLTRSRDELLPLLVSGRIRVRDVSGVGVARG